jgi:hypothetical protein
LSTPPVNWATERTIAPANAAYHADERLAPLQVSDLAGGLQIGLAGPPVVPGKHAARDERAEA